MTKLIIFFIMTIIHLIYGLNNDKYQSNYSSKYNNFTKYTSYIILTNIKFIFHILLIFIYRFSYRIIIIKKKLYI